MHIDRLALVRQLLKKERCSYILVSDPVDIHYICGFRSSHAYLLINNRNAVLFTDFRYQEAAEKFVGRNPHWQFELVSGSTFTFLQPFVRKRSRVGIQSESITVDDFDELEKVCESCRFVKLGGKVPSLSLRKDATEIRAMQKAAKAGEKALGALVKRLRYGITEQDAARMLESLCKEYGSEKPSFDTIMLFGKRAALPHGTPSRRKLRQGDFVLIDFGCTVDGFCSDMTRTFVAGKASEKQKEIYTIVKHAQQLGRMQVSPGVKASEIDAVVRSYIQQQGYGDAFGHATGHGVGRRIHENPRVSKSDDTVLEPGMVITIEPGIYIPSTGGVRIEDMVEVTEDGSRTIHRYSHGLTELALS